jgi:hypothetical protein
MINPTYGVHMSDQVEMHQYIGTKRLFARSMSRGDYNNYRGWTIPDDENPSDAGYLVEYIDGGKANDSRHLGYISWSPADVFDRCYRPIYISEYEQIIEQDIQAKGLTAPRVTPADIEANIIDEVYFTAEQGYQRANEDEGVPAGAYDKLKLLTFCVLVLRNGFNVTGESACASLENFDAELGRKIARQNAVAKIWPLMGYELRTKLASA